MHNEGRAALGGWFGIRFGAKGPERHEGFFFFFVGQRQSPEVFAEEARLRNGQRFLRFDCLCGSANQKTGQECGRRQNGEMFSRFPKAPLHPLLCEGSEDKLRL